MTDREQKIRDTVARVLATPAVSAEYPLLSLDDAVFLLALLDAARGRPR